MKRVKESMYIGKDNIFLDTNNVFRDVIEIMNVNHLGAVSITQDKKVVGIITDGDVRRLLLRTQKTLPELFMTKVEKVMKKNPVVINATSSLDDALDIMEKNKFTVMPVVDKKKKLIGIIHIHKLLIDIVGGEKK